MFLIVLNFQKNYLMLMSFNPLNQVYVFNNIGDIIKLNDGNIGFNPLNQVYVFNSKLAENYRFSEEEF